MRTFLCACSTKAGKTYELCIDPSFGMIGCVSCLRLVSHMFLRRFWLRTTLGVVSCSVAARELSGCWFLLDSLLIASSFQKVQPRETIVQTHAVLDCQFVHPWQAWQPKSKLPPSSARASKCTLGSRLFRPFIVSLTTRHFSTRASCDFFSREFL